MTRGETLQWTSGIGSQRRMNSWRSRDRRRARITGRSVNGKGRDGGRRRGGGEGDKGGELGVGLGGQIDEAEWLGSGDGDGECSLRCNGVLVASSRVRLRWIL